MAGGPSIVFTRKSVVDETYIRNSSIVCKSIVGIDASQLYPFSNWSRVFLKKNLDVHKGSACVAKHIAAMTTSQTSSKSAVKV